MLPASEGKPVNDQVPPPPGSIVITPKEFYDGISNDIAEIKQAVSPLPDLKVKVDAHDERLTKLERLAWTALGVAFASGGADLINVFK